VGLGFIIEPKQVRACERNEGVREGYTLKETKRREREREREIHTYIYVYTYIGIHRCKYICICLYIIHKVIYIYTERAREENI